MKQAKHLLAVIFTVFIIGCELDGAIVTVVQPPLDAFQTSRSHSENINVIVLSQVLRAPPGGTILVIQGKVVCGITVYSVDSVGPDPRYAVSVNLAVRATLRPGEYDMSAWTISADSYDEMPLTEAGSVTFEKRYSVAERPDSLALVIRYRAVSGALAEQHLEVAAMWLELSNVERALDGN